MCQRYSAKDIMTFQKATGLGVMESKSFLLTKSPLLCEKILLAYKLKQSRIKQGLSTKSYLYDPIEDDPQYREIFKEVCRKVEIIIEAENQKRIDDFKRENKDFLSYILRRGSLYREESTKQKYLLEQYNIQYSSIIEMNPGIIFN